VWSGAVASIEQARELIARSFPALIFEPSGKGAWDRAYASFRSLVGAAA
jgi:rhamnulokinase